MNRKTAAYLPPLFTVLSCSLRRVAPLHCPVWLQYKFWAFIWLLCAFTRFFSQNRCTFGGYANGFVADVVCDAPFAWKNRKVKEKVDAPTSLGYYPDITNIDLYNTSSDHNLTIPSLIEVDLGENSTGFKLTNLSNNSKFFEFRNLIASERIRIDDLFCIESITRPNTIIIDCFSSEFLRLINGINRIVINGQIKRIKIAYQSGRKIG